MRYSELIKRMDSYFVNSDNIYKSKYGRIDRLTDNPLEDLRQLFVEFAAPFERKEYKEDDLLLNLDNYLDGDFFILVGIDSNVLYILKSDENEGYLIVKDEYDINTILGRVSNFRSRELLKKLLEIIITTAGDIFYCDLFDSFPSEIYIYETPLTKIELNNYILKLAKNCEAKLKSAKKINTFWEKLAEILDIQNFENKTLNQTYKKLLVKKYIRECCSIDKRLRFSR